MKVTHNKLVLALSLTLAAQHASAKPINGLSWEAELGIGYDSNIYQTPDSSYIDLSQSPTVTINPAVQSGAFIPLGMAFSYDKGLSQSSVLKTGYRFNTKRYIDDQYDNANETTHRIDLGGEYIFNQIKSKKDSLQAGFFIKDVEEFYVDRDSGEDKLSGTTDISERYNYDSIGFELEYKNKTSEIQYGLSWLIEQRDYVDTVVVSQYDNDYQKLSADVEIRLAKPTKLYFDYNLANRTYDERPSRDLDGGMPSSNPAREYDYQSLETTIRHKINKTWVAYVNYKYSTREDLHVGYNDYTGHTVKGRLLHKTDKARTRLALSYKTLDYDNALAFEEIAGGKKTYDAMEASVSTELPQNDNRSLWGEIKYNAVDTNDSRYEYDRYRIAAGYKWEF